MTRTSMAIWTIALLVILVCWSSFCHGEDSSTLLFKTNTETFTDIPVLFHQTLPSWLVGNLMTNGMGQFEFGSRKFTHVFDGYSKINSWKFYPNQTCTYSSAFVQSYSYEAAHEQDRIANYILFGPTTPAFTRWNILEALYRGVDNTNINIYKFGPPEDEQFVTLSDFWLTYQVSPLNLTTFRTIDPSVPGANNLYSLNGIIPVASSSHPLPEHNTTNHITFASLINAIPFLHDHLEVIRVISTDRRELVARISMPKVPHMHSFGLSRNYALMFASPLFANSLNVALTGTISQSLEWREDLPLIIYMVNIHTGVVEEYKTDPVFPMHQINAYEDENNQVIADVVTYPNISFMEEFKLANVLDPVKRRSIHVDARLRRYTFNRNQKTVDVMEFHNEDDDFINRMDLPVINEQYRQKRYCYTYGVVPKGNDQDIAADRLVKKDLCSEGGNLYWTRANHYPMEPTFIPRPGATGEDDGILLSTVLNGDHRHTYLGIWDAKTMELLNYGNIPTIIPYLVHGHFFAGGKYL